MAADSWFGDTERVSDLRMTQPHEVTELNDFGFDGLLSGEAFEGVIHGEHRFIRVFRRHSDLFDVDVFLVTASAQSCLGSRAVDQDAPHRFGCGGEEMAAAIPLAIFLADEPQPGFMDESGGLKRVIGGFVRHLVRGEFAQLLVNERQQFFGGVRLTALHLFKNLSYLAHLGFIPARG